MSTTEQIYTTRTSCRICGNRETILLHSFGDHHVNGFLADGEESVGTVPIDIDYCPKCTLVQQRHTPSPEILYTDHYWYRSGTTRTMYEALRDIVRDVEELVPLTQDDIVLDIGSNDGTLLRHYQGDSIRIGVEPAANLVEEGREGIDILIHELWDASLFLACTEKYGVKAKVITAIGMFYDLDDPNEFIADVAACLEDEGLFVAQLMCLHNMMMTNDVGNFAHEHLEFYTFQSLQHLFYKHGLEIFDVKTNNVNGESYRIYARKMNSPLLPREGAGERIQQAINREKTDNPVRIYRRMFDEMEFNKLKTIELLEELHRKGKKVWIYGASTKGNTILQYYGLDSRLLQGAADKSSEKWGKRTVGSNIPIYSEADARIHNPDYFFVLPYAFVNEFVEREREWRDNGGLFIVPLPTLRIV